MILGGKDFALIDPLVGLRLAIDHSTGIPYVAYVGNAPEAYIKIEKFENDVWQRVAAPLGDRMQGFLFSGNNIPYLCSLGINSVGLVYKYNSSQATWESQGSTVTNEGVYGMSLAVNSVGATDIPYVAYNTISSSKNVLRVSKLEGSNWMAVGGEVGEPVVNNVVLNLKIDGDGVLYVKYNDAQNGDKIAIKRYVSTMDAWVAVGDPDTGDAISSVLELSNGIPYLAYKQGPLFTVGTLEVKKYEGGVWNSLGSPGRSDMVGQLFVEGTTVYCFFSDSDQGGKPFLKKNNGAGWVDVGGAITNYDSNPNFMEIYNGVPYLTYSVYSDNYAVKYIGP
jgi:hypothetical protein